MNNLSTNQPNIESFSNFASRSAAAPLYKQLDLSIDIDHTSTVLPGGMQAAINPQQEIVYATYPSGHAVRRTQTTILVLTPEFDHWVSCKSGAWSRVD